MYQFFARLLVWLTLVSATIAITTGCSPKEANSEAGTTQLRRSIEKYPDSLDQFSYRSTQSSTVLQDVGEGLATYAPDGQIEPGIAESWNEDSTGLVVTFRLRTDARWSDGSQITAQDFVRTFEKLISDQTQQPVAKYFAAIRGAKARLDGDEDAAALGVTAIDDQTLSIQLETPVAYLLELLTLPATYPSHANNPDSPEQRLSSGAYRFSNVRPPRIIELERNPHYWNRDSVYFDRVSYRVMEPDAQANAFLTGELDFTDGIAAAQFRTLRESIPESVRITPSLGVYYVGFNLGAPPFDDHPEVIRALDLVLDREVIVERITGRGELPAYSFVPPSLPGYTSPKTDDQMLDEAEKLAIAQQIFSDAGFSEDNPFEFEYRYNTFDLHRKIAVTLQQTWENALPVRVTLYNEEFRSFLNNLQQPDGVQAFRLAWTGDYRDPSAFLSLFRSDHPNNFSRYESATVDASLDAALIESNREARNARFKQIEQDILNTRPVVPIYFLVYKHLVAESLKGFEGNSVDVQLSRHFSK